MESAKTVAAETAPTTESQSYAMGLLRHAARVVVAVVVVPLTIWQAAKAYGHKTQAADAAASSGASLATTLTGGGALIVGGLTVNELCMAAGAVVAVIGLVWQVVLGWRNDRRLQREHALRVREMEARLSDLGKDHP